MSFIKKKDGNVIYLKNLKGRSTEQTQSDSKLLSGPWSRQQKEQASAFHLNFKQYSAVAFGFMVAIGLTIFWNSNPTYNKDHTGRSITIKSGQNRDPLGQTRDEFEELLGLSYIMTYDNHSNTLLDAEYSGEGRPIYIQSVAKFIKKYRNILPEYTKVTRSKKGVFDEDNQITIRYYQFHKGYEKTEVAIALDKSNYLMSIIVGE